MRGSGSSSWFDTVKCGMHMMLQLAVLSLQLLEPLQSAGTQPVVLPTPPVDSVRWLMSEWAQCSIG